MQVVCVGLATLDTILVLPRLPGPDDRVVVTDSARAGGGPAATAAVALARLGVETAFVGAVGDDAAGAEIRDGLAAEGLDVSGLRVVAGARSPQSTILVGPGGTRTILHVPGTAPLEAGDLPDADWVHVDHVGYPAVRGRGFRLSVDGGNPIEGLDLAEVALYAPTEAALLTVPDTVKLTVPDTVKFTVPGTVKREPMDLAAAAVAAGAEIVVFTRGAGGSAAVTRDGERIEVPAPQVEAVSTLGAGDVFHGALLAFLVRGLPLRDALAEANRVAAESCRALDGRSAIPRA